LSLRDQEGTKSKSLLRKEEVLERIDGENRGRDRERREERRKRKFANLEREERLEMRYLLPKTN
jgi:hypothetical protein